MFDPNTHKNQHYVPVFWQKRFADNSGSISCLKNNNIEPGSAKKQMSSDWIYTIYDEFWVPNNHLEIASSKFENDAAEIFEMLDDSNNTISFKDQFYLRWFIAFSICRHPDSMSTGNRKGKELANLLPKVHSLTLDEFFESLSKFHFSKEEAEKLYDTCKQHPLEQLEKEAKEVEKMSQSDPRLPEQLSIDNETIERVLFLLGHHNIVVLDAPPKSSFILGDTPFPTILYDEFKFPISSKIALHWKAGASENFPLWSREVSNKEEVDDLNQQQFDNSLEIVIGSSEILKKYLA